MLAPMGVCFLTPMARPAVTSGKGHGSIAVAPIAAGETVAAFGGRCVTRDEFDCCRPANRCAAFRSTNRCTWRVRRSRSRRTSSTTRCDPNCVPSGNVVLVALRDIAVGEELSYDYATTDGSDYDEFECACGTASVPRQGHRPRLDAARAAAALPRLVQSVPRRRIAALVHVGAERRAFAL